MNICRFGIVLWFSVRLSIGHILRHKGGGGGATKQYLLNYSVHSYHQKVKIIKQILTFVVR